MPATSLARQRARAKASAPTGELRLASSVAFVARQPIFDRDRRLVGYELLYRANPASEFAGVEASGSQMTGSTLVNSVLGIGLDQLTGSAPAWVNFPRELLLNHDFEVLDPRRCIIELLETVDCDDESVAACAALREKGFTLALDDYVDTAAYEPLVSLANVVKLSVLDVDECQLADAVARLLPKGVKLLAEKVETRDSFDYCKALGFSYFQGYHFSRPEVIQRHELPVEMVRIAALMQLAVSNVKSDREIERELRTDPGLSFKLLRLVNSAASGGRGVNSILHAIRLVGRASLHRWLALLFVSATPRTSDVDRELILLTLERGRFCELIAIAAGDSAVSGQLFLVGLLSSFDSVLGIPMPRLLNQVCVSDDVEAALLGSPGPYTPYLKLAAAYAAADWDTVAQVGGGVGVVADLPRLYGEAGAWARAQMRSV
jgi:c-di-GMP-related signal transduction protein